MTDQAPRDLPHRDLAGTLAAWIAVFTDLDRAGARFEVLDTAWPGSAADLGWPMRAQVRDVGDWRSEGMNEVRFDPEGRVAEHLDYWDAAGQCYGPLPVIGPLMRWLAPPIRVA